MSDEVMNALKEGLDGVKQELDAKVGEHTAQVLEQGKAQTALTDKINELAEKHESLMEEVTQLAMKTDPGVSGELKTAGELFIASDAYKEIVGANSRNASVRLEVKNTTINSNLSAVFGDSTTVFPNQRQGVIGGDFVPRTIRSRIPAVTVSTDAVNALRESAWSSSAAETAQGAAKPESTISFEQYNVPIECVAHWIKVTNRLLADAPAVASYINTRLRDGLAQRVEAQLLNGNGTTPNISGLTDTGNFTAFQASGPTDNLIDSINKAKYQLWALGNMPDTVIVNPADWGSMERIRESSGSGTYLYGAPGTEGSMSPFGVQVVLSTHMTQGSFLIGALRANTLIYERQMATIEMGYVDDDFTRNLVTIRAEERLALSVDKATAILYGDITGT